MGTVFLKGGYNLGRSQATHTSVGWLLPLTMLGFLVLLFIFPQIEAQDKSGVLFYSVKGPGSMHAPLFVSLVIGLTDTSMENVSHAATSQGWNLKGVEPEGTGFRITISKE